MDTDSLEMKYQEFELAVDIAIAQLIAFSNEMENGLTPHNINSTAIYGTATLLQHAVEALKGDAATASA